jgi:hypothetical protein
MRDVKTIIRDVKTIMINNSRDRARVPNNIGALVVLVVFLSISVIVQVTTSTRLIPVPDIASRMSTSLCAEDARISDRTDISSMTTE